MLLLMVMKLIEIDTFDLMTFRRLNPQRSPKFKKRQEREFPLVMSKSENMASFQEIIQVDLVGLP